MVVYLTCVEMDGFGLVYVFCFDCRIYELASTIERGDFDESKGKLNGAI